MTATSDADRFCLAQISDPHLTTLAGASWRQLCSKRVLGYLSWRRRRRFIHSPAVLDRLLADPPLRDADLVAVTGDLTHVGLPAEHLQAGAWLNQLGDPAWVQVIPGNHEAYVAIDWTRDTTPYQAYLQGDESRLPIRFPALRRRGPAAVIGINSAVPTPPFFASGRVGDTQLAELEALLYDCGRQGLCRVVLIHHPPVPGTEKWRKRLVDAARFTKVIAAAGAELVIHGHSHSWIEESLPSRGRDIPVVGIPSASSLSRDPRATAGYAIYQVARTAAGWQIDLHRRRYGLQSDRFEPSGSRRWLLDRA